MIGATEAQQVVTHIYQQMALVDAGVYAWTPCDLLAIRLLSAYERYGTLYELVVGQP